MMKALSVGKSALVWALTVLLFLTMYLYYYHPSLGLAKSKALPLSLHCNLGRLGNQMCSYATLYGISALNNRNFVVLSCNAVHLKEIFVGPSQAPSVSEEHYKQLNPWELTPYFKPGDGAIPPNCNFLNGYLYPCSFTFFDHVRDEIRQEFRFRDPIPQYAQAILRKANIQELHDPTYVGVHVRRGDYKERWLDAFEGVPVNMEYFEKSLGYFRKKYKNVIFVAVSDDRTWCIKHLSSRFGVYVPKEAPSPGHDLALLASCNHTVMTYGTFGFWGAYLAGGEVLYFDKFLKPDTNFTRTNFVFEKMYPPDWKGVVTVNASVWSNSNSGHNITSNS